jgi:hypothetical protein
MNRHASPSRVEQFMQSASHIHRILSPLIPTMLGKLQPL